MTVVLDASVVIESAFAGGGSQAGSASRTILPHLAEKFGFAAPALLAWEVGNVVHTKAPDRFGDTVDERRRAREVLLSGIDLVAANQLDPDSIGRLCQRYGLTYYDASYLALAGGHADGLLLTEDRTLLEAARSELGPDRGHHAVSALHYVRDGIL